MCSTYNGRRWGDRHIWYDGIIKDVFESCSHVFRPSRETWREIQESGLSNDRFVVLGMRAIAGSNLDGVGRSRRTPVYSPTHQGA